MLNTDHQSQGYIGLLLHAHLPYINNPGNSPSLEEKWLFEALTETYIPFIMSWQRLAAEGIDFHLTLSLSPTLLSMVMDPVFIERYGVYLDRLKELANREVARTAVDPAFRPVADFYRRRIDEVDHAFKTVYGTNLIAPLKALHEQGHIELITTCATHGFLPLILTEEARSAQIRTGLELFQDVFGWSPSGLWLPECGYTPGLEDILDSFGIRYFIIASHGMFNAYPQVETGVYAPVKLVGEREVAVFGRDWETSHQVWSRSEGYPGDPCYREFYRDIGYDLDYEYIRPYLIGDLRGDTGLKYYRITGQTDAKEIYNRDEAIEQVRAHAIDFLDKRDQQVERLLHSKIEAPIVVAPYDAELFGHWWFEGPEWVETVFRLADSPERKARFTTFSQYLAQFPPRQEVSLGPSSWGDGGFNRVWLNKENDWIHPHLHRAEKAMIVLADRFSQPKDLEKRALNQAMRELLSAQSSDWPFILTNQTVIGYAKQRLNEHLEHFRRLSEGLLANRTDPDYLASLEGKDRLFPRADYQIYQSKSSLFAGITTVKDRRPMILMLSWEYPPQHVGGLGIHVRDLAEALVQLDLNVHVITLTSGNSDETSLRSGVYVHSLAVAGHKGSGNDFFSWTLQYNLAMADFGRELIRRSAGAPIVIHAHDWMVSYAARELQRTFVLPLTATIHATEHGRNKGLHNDTHLRIHRLESDLAAAADQVICCSRYMEQEIHELFKIKPEQITSIPNAVGVIPYQGFNAEGRHILFIGRLVVEKGVQVLLDAFAGLLNDYPDARLTIAGHGPCAAELKEKAQFLGISDQVRFTGFVSEGIRNKLLSQSRVAVFPSLYEPFGIVALEAMASGVPVIASRTGGLAETIDDGLTGLLCKPGDAGDLRRAMAALFDETELAAELSRNARAKVDRCYTWDAVARQTRELYDKVLRKENLQVS